MIQFSINAATAGQPVIYLLDNSDKLETLDFSPQEAIYIREAGAREQSMIVINRYTEFHLVFLLKQKKSEAATSDAIRKSGAELSGMLKSIKAAGIHVINHSSNVEAAALFGQGLALASY